MLSEYIPLDDPRVTLACSRVGRVYSLDGAVQSGTHPYPHTSHANGLHQEPRMTSVMAPVRTWNLNKGDWCEIEVEDVPLLGIVLELAEHHWDCDLYIDGQKVYGEFGCVSTYQPASDGFGYIHWLLLDRGRHHIKLVVSERYNRMHDLCHVEPDHACINGFILMADINFPPPLFSSWMFTQADLPGDRRHAKGSLQETVIPGQGHLYLMDLHGRGSLDTLTFAVTAPVILEVIDGGVAQAEFPRDFPSWIRRVDIAAEAAQDINTTTVEIMKRENARYQVNQVKPLVFGSRLIVRLFNPGHEAQHVSNLYMEGTLKSM